jgi:hypothetical protein
MISRRSLLSAVLVAASIAANGAQGDTSILGYVGSSSFWMDVPRGWDSDPPTASKLKVIFVLTPAGSTFDSAPAFIMGSPHANSSVAEAMDKVRAGALSKDPAAQITALPSLEVGKSTISLLEIRSSATRPHPLETVAFIPLQNNVVVVRLSAATEEPYNRGRAALTDVLKSHSP